MSRIKKIAGEVSGVSIFARQSQRLRRSTSNLFSEISELREAAKNAPPQFKKPTSGRGHSLDSALNTVPPLVAMGVMLIAFGGLVYLQAPYIGPYLGIVILLTGIWCFWLAGVFLVGWWQTKNDDNQEH